MSESTVYFCGMAATVFITTSLVVAAVRWFHMCRPYDKHASHYYPGRPSVVMAYLSSLALIPYALHPESLDAWYLTQMFFLPFTLLGFSLLLFSYFGDFIQWKNWKWPLVAVGAPIVLALVAALVMAVWPGEQLGVTVNPVLADCLLYIPGSISTIICFIIMTIVHLLARSVNEDNFSNPEDFPVVLARRWILLIFINLFLCWTAILLGDQQIMAVIMFLFSVSSVIFIISALHPHRTGPIELGEEAEEAVPEEETAPKREVSSKKRLEILSSIHLVVVEQQAYLEPHLTIQDVADRCGYSRSYIAGIIKSEYGGFFDYINNLRLMHVTYYLQHHPGSTVQEAAEAAGFNSRQAYYTVKARLEQQRSSVQA